jgi:hypothetical protein
VLAYYINIFPFFVNTFIIIMSGMLWPSTVRGVVPFLTSSICANRNFLGLRPYNHLNWKNHIELMILKLREAGHAVRSVVHISNVTGLKSIYFTFFHSIIKYRIIPWG